MICRWCKGTGKWNDHNDDTCEVCNKGITTDPPFGPICSVRDNEELDILSREDFDHIINYDKRDILQQIEYVSYFLVKTQCLTDEELQKFYDYWNDPYRDETLGEVLNRVAWLVKQKTFSY